MNDAKEFALLYDDFLVGTVRQAFFDDGTWFGVLEKNRDLTNSRAKRVYEYMEFCKTWNSKTLQNPDHPPDQAEFTRFSDIIANGTWCVRTSDKLTHKIADAPVFFPGDEVSWQLVEFDQIAWEPKGVVLIAQRGKKGDEGAEGDILIP